MPSQVRAIATSTALRASANTRGEYGEKRKGGPGAIALILGMTVAVYALSPGARHWYKHGRLPG